MTTKTIKKITNANLNIIYKKDIDDTGRDIKLYDVDDCLLVGRNNYYPNILIDCKKDTLIDPYTEKVMSLQKTSWYDETYTFNLEYDVIIDEPVYFFIYNTDNYYHFIYDTLSYLFCYFELDLKCKILVNFSGEHKKELYKFVSETYEMLGISDRILFHNKTNFYKKVFISSSLTFEGVPNNPPRSEIFQIYNKLSRICNIVSPCTHVYISRRTWIHNKLDNIGTNYTQRRKMINEDKLVEKLVKLGFREIFTENMSMVEKICLFKSAKYVIGSIGGGMCNLIFSNKNTKAICIESPYFLKINERFKYSLEIADLKYFSGTKIFCEKNQEISNYVRVKIIDTNSEFYDAIGEIDYYDNEKYNIIISNNDTGWNIQNIFTTKQFTRNQFIPLDDGLNSPYDVDIDKLSDLISYFFQISI